MRLLLVFVFRRPCRLGRPAIFFPVPPRARDLPRPAAMKRREEYYCKITGGAQEHRSCAPGSTNQAVCASYPGQLSGPAIRASYLGRLSAAGICGSSPPGSGDTPKGKKGHWPYCCFVRTGVRDARGRRWQERPRGTTSPNADRLRGPGGCRVQSAWRPEEFPDQSKRIRCLFWRA